MKQTIIRPQGIVSQPNEYSEVAPGTLSVGDNIQIRRSSVIEPRNAFEDWHASFGVRAAKIWEIGDGLIMEVHTESGGTGACVLDGSTVENLIFGSATFSAGKTFITRARDRVIYTNDYAPAIFTPGAGAPYSVRQAGIPPLFLAGIGTTTGTAWLEDNFLAYAAVLRRTDSDGYVVRGAVSTKLIASNVSGTDAMPRVLITWPSTHTIAANDVIELYRVPQQESADLLGDEFRLAIEYEVTSADIAAGFAFIFDTCLETALSSYMYTNPSQKGADKTYLMPPPSSDVVTFKRATFYNATSLWHQVVARIPNKWGDLTTPEELEYGIGERATTGDFTATSATFTVADATGIKIGQSITTSVTDLHLTKVTNVVGTSITVSGPSGQTINGAAIAFRDVVCIDGVDLISGGPSDLVSAFGQAMIDGTIQTYLFASPTISQDGTSVEGQLLTFMNAIPPDSFTIKATNGQNYSPPLAEYAGAAQTSTDDPRTNRLVYSLEEQPENVPPINFFYVGGGTILKLWATQDSLFAFCTDGIYRIDGDGDDWSQKPFDPDTILLAPDAVDSMDNQIYAFTTSGLVAFSDSEGIQKISAPLIGEDVRDLWTQFEAELPYTWGVQIACDKYRHEVWLNFYDLAEEELVKTYIWNVDTRTFVTQSAIESLAVAYAPSLRSILVSNGDDVLEYDPESWMPTEVRFNSVFAEDLGLLKQWIDVTMFLEDLADDAEFSPSFEDVYYSSAYVIEATAGAFDHVIAPLLTAVHNKHMRFGYTTGAYAAGDVPYYKLKGLTYRYRLAAEPLRQ